MATRSRRPQDRGANRVVNREHATPVVAGDRTLDDSAPSLLEAATLPPDAATLDRPQDEDDVLRKVFAVLDVTSLPPILDELKRRLRLQTRRPLRPLIEQSTKALRNIELAREALRVGKLQEEDGVNLLGVGYTAGFYDGFDYSHNEVHQIISNLKKRAEREIRAQNAQKSGPARTENLREEWNRWHGEAFQLRRENLHWSRRRIMEQVARGANPRRSWRTVDQKVRQLETTRGSIDA